MMLLCVLYNLMCVCIYCVCVLAIHSDLAQLDKEVVSIKQGAFAAGTNANLQSQWRIYYSFCSDFNITPLPASQETICRYIAYLCRRLRSYQSVKNYLHGLSTLHASQGLPFIGLAHYNIHIMLLSVRKTLGNTPFAKLPLEPYMLLAIKQKLNPAVSKDVAFWAATLLGFFGFLRKGNLVPPSATRFDPRRHLSRSNIVRAPHGLDLYLQLTKTLQNRDSSLHITISAISHILDPVTAYDFLLHTVPAPATSPAFVYYAPSGALVTLTHSTYVSQLKSVLRSIGVNPNLYSGHSLRRGGCTLC